MPCSLGQGMPLLGATAGTESPPPGLNCKREIEPDVRTPPPQGLRSQRPGFCFLPFHCPPLPPFKRPSLQQSPFPLLPSNSSAPKVGGTRPWPLAAPAGAKQLLESLESGQQPLLPQPGLPFRPGSAGRAALLPPPTPSLPPPSLTHGWLMVLVTDTALPSCARTDTWEVPKAPRLAEVRL